MSLRQLNITSTVSNQITSVYGNVKHDVIPVSYTHLDVYKRQVENKVQDTNDIANHQL